MAAPEYSAERHAEERQLAAAARRFAGNPESYQKLCAAMGRLVDEPAPGEFERVLDEQLATDRLDATVYAFDMARRNPGDERAEQIRRVCSELAEFLCEKNASYGDSAANPIGVFAKGLDAEAQIHVRIDDKLNRIKRGSEYPGDDTVKDLAGYLVLLMVVRAAKGGE